LRAASPAVAIHLLPGKWSPPPCPPSPPPVLPLSRSAPKRAQKLGTMGRRLHMGCIYTSTFTSHIYVCIVCEKLMYIHVYTCADVAPSAHVYTYMGCKSWCIYINVYIPHICMYRVRACIHVQTSAHVYIHPIHMYESCVYIMDI